MNSAVNVNSDLVIKTPWDIQFPVLGEGVRKSLCEAGGCRALQEEIFGTEVVHPFKSCFFFFRHMVIS